MLDINIQFFGGRGSGGGKGGGSGKSSKSPIPQSQVNVSTDRYMYAHGSSPRGTGNWAFEIGSETKFFGGSYADAKRKAIKYAASIGEREIQVGT